MKKFSMNLKTVQEGIDLFVEFIAIEVKNSVSLNYKNTELENYFISFDLKRDIDTSISLYKKNKTHFGTKEKVKKRLIFLFKKIFEKKFPKHMKIFSEDSEN